MTPEQLQAIRERCEKATPGPWEVTSFAEDDVHVTVGYKYENGIHSANWIADIHEGEDDTTTDERFADAEFISHARTDIPALLDEIERLRGALEWFANPDHYTETEDEEGFRDAPLVACNGLRIARQALEDSQ